VGNRPRVGNSPSMVDFHLEGPGTKPGPFQALPSLLFLLSLSLFFLPLSASLISFLPLPLCLSSFLP